MNSNFWTILFGVGVVQGVFLIIALLFQKHSNQSASRWLALLVAVFTITILGEVLEKTLPSDVALIATFLNINTELAIGPALYLLIRSIVKPSQSPSPKDALHFLPWLVGCITWGSAWLMLDPQLNITNIDLHATPGLPYFLVFKVSYFVTYAIASYRCLARGIREANRFSVGRKPVRIGWLKKWLLGLYFVPVVSYSFVLLELRGFEPPVESDQAAILLATALIYLLAFLVLLRPWVLSIRTSSGGAGRPTPASNQLMAYLSDKKTWLDPDLGLADLAKSLGMPESQLSSVINDDLNTTFYALITGYRLGEFERLTKDRSMKEQSILDLAYNAGFNSKASFYRAFRDKHGTTPTAFRRAQNLQLEENPSH